MWPTSTTLRSSSPLTPRDIPRTRKYPAGGSGLAGRSRYGGGSGGHNCAAAGCRRRADGVPECRGLRNEFVGGVVLWLTVVVGLIYHSCAPSNFRCLFGVSSQTKRARTAPALGTRASPRSLGVPYSAALGSFVWFACMPQSPIPGTVA